MTYYRIKQGNSVFHDIPYYHYSDLLLFRKTYAPYKFSYIGKINSSYQFTGTKMEADQRKTAIMIEEIKKCIKINQL
jgi:hypothetical protein